MRIERAATTDSRQALRLLIETAEWLRGKGSSQWSDVLEGADKHGLAEAVQRGDVYYYYNHEELVGMFAAWKTPSDWDRLLWGTLTEAGNACYLHRIIIRPAYKGKGYGNQLLTDIKTYFKNEVKELRLDCLASNPKLVSFYSKNGFKKVATSQDSQKIEFELFSFKLE